ncbi:MAG: ECF transporter S component [Synergistetes bacterium]|nr:ECF transporter S component [Synergistota bacterium]
MKKVKFITYGGILLAVAALFPGLHLPQYVTGPVVNFTIILATYVLGTIGGVILGCLTPWVAFISGLMPVAFLPPIIMVGNGIYTLSFGLLKNTGLKGMIAGIIAGAFLKYLFLSYAVTHIVHAPPKLVQMLSLPQLFTALVGGVIAVLVVKTGYIKGDVLK